MQVEFGHLLPNGTFIRVASMREQLPCLVEEYGGIDCYASVFEYDDISKPDCAMWGPFAMDFDYAIDGDDALNVVRMEALAAISYMKVALCVPKHSIRCYFSGAKGFHIVVPPGLWFDEPTRNLHKRFRALAEDVKVKCNLKTIDMSLYGWRHLLRLPDTINGKTGLYKIELTHEELRHVTWSGLRDLASSMRGLLRLNGLIAPPGACNMARAVLKSAVAAATERRPQANAAGFGKMFADFTEDPPCVVRLLRDPRAPGTRNMAVCLLASYYAQRGMPANEAVDNLAQWNLDVCSPPLPYVEVQKTTHSIYNARHRYQYGCTSFAEYGGCDDSCQLKRYRNTTV